jgi:hypothetical protein
MDRLSKTKSEPSSNTIELFMLTPLIALDSPVILHVYRCIKTLSANKRANIFLLIEHNFLTISLISP